ncbi:replication-relaxation family protein [Paenibacillus enshidis]|uniref:Replication-relaxation family protein n=1 Tax=Paenibacillus enshidis TaxID=1458439 RepID=A0ABV5AVB2_9BACL
MSTNNKENEKNEYSLGETIDLLSDIEWTFLIDLYKCRFMKREAIMEYYFEESPENFYKNFDALPENEKDEYRLRNEARIIKRMNRMRTRLKQRGLIEYSSLVPESGQQGRSIKGGWVYLTNKGLRVVERRLEIPDAVKLSKLEIDMQRAKKDHFWELANIYLTVKYKIIKEADSDSKQFHDWDWHPSEAITSDSEDYLVRPDAILRYSEQLFFVELDRSTEPIYRSPIYSEQVSIRSKLEKYQQVFRYSSNDIIRNGYIAFIVPTAIHKTRLENIRKAAAVVFPNQTKVLVGKNMQDIMIAYSGLLK